MSGANGPGRVNALIVGAGPAGAVAAAFLAQSGVTVVCLEQGDWTNAAEYPGNHAEWELLEHEAWSPDPNRRRREADYPIEVSESDYVTQMFAGVGGSTILYRGHWTRFLPSDFRVRSLDGVADDWPFSYEDLVPYYEAIDLAVGTAGLAGDPAYPPGAPPPLPPHPITQIGRKVAMGMNELGWHWWPAPNSIATRKYNNLNACVRYGTCISGCPNGSKASFDRVFWPDALEAGAQLVTGARVRSITVDDAGLATGASYIDRQGKEHHQSADVVILAANAVGNARLLLLSASSRFRDGLANSSGLVGLRLMTHPSVGVVGIFDDEFRSWQGPYGQQIQSLEFYETDTSRGFVRGAKWGLLPTGGPLSAALASFTASNCETEASVHAGVRERIGHSIQWGILVEDLPLESNRVVLDDQLTDSDGIPAPKIIARDDENTQRNLEFQTARATESLLSAGARKVLPPVIRPTRSHNMGTTMMGDDPATSVVNQFGRAHDVPNLYIYGASTFPTGSGLNPTATICAVTLRSVEHLVTAGRLQKVPA